ncbi:sodium:calcium antiporter [Rubrivivax gelatinosus]|uniref:Cation:H+ antiporter n=1 Tax=Rubrivivax gelatinosus TaxID=28068 RepID=A0A4V2SFR6_RUBGE|nr:sodium:calcium antiporter [Rubrivivax gelatinosus]TCO98387.1 cation:H+ antiporter [Rubrivivax gelatinosus]
MNLAWLSIQFLLCAAAIAAAGFVLSRSADTLAAAYGWGRGWVGLALLATVTSLPELASGVSAVALVGAPNLAVGNALGACVVNLAFLVVVDLLQRGQPMYREAGSTHLLSAGFGVVMLGFVTMSLVTGAAAPQFLGVGLYSPVLLALYLLALRSVFAHENAQRASGAPAAATRPPGVRLRREWRRFGAAALVVLAAGTWLPGLADGLSQALGLSRSFVGTVFMALVTTLPEMAVTVSALRLGALDMAIGNLLGSNLFNVLVLAIDDLVYTRGPLLADADPAHAGSAATALVMTGLVIVGLVMRPQGRVLRTASWVSVGLAAAYAVNAALIFLAGA